MSQTNDRPSLREDPPRIPTYPICRSSSSSDSGRCCITDPGLTYRDIRPPLQLSATPPPPPPRPATTADGFPTTESSSRVTFQRRSEPGGRTEKEHALLIPSYPSNQMVADSEQISPPHVDVAKYR